MRKQPLRTLAAIPILLGSLGAQNPNAEKPPVSGAPRHPQLYQFDTSTLADRLAEKLEKAPNRDVLRWAIVQLGHMGEEAVPALRRAFYRNFTRGENFPVLSNICEALGQTRSKEAVPILLDGAAHPSGVVRSRAVDSLVFIQDAESFSYLRALFPIETKEYQSRLLKGMATLGSKEFVPFAEEIFQTQAFGLQEICLQYVAERYVRQGEDLLRKVFRDTHSTRMKIVAAMGLVQLEDEDALTFLEKAVVEEPVLDDRIKAMHGLSAAHKIDPLIPLQHSSDTSIRSGLVAALAVSLQREDPVPNTPESRKRAMELLHVLAKDSTPFVRNEAVKLLAKLGDRSGLDPFLDLLREESHPDRLKEAIELLIDPTIQEKRAVPILVKRLKGAGMEHQKLFMQALAALHDERGVAPLLECLTNPPKDQELAYQEYTALQLGFLGKPAVEPLLRLAKETKDGTARFWAIQALVWTQDPAAADFLLDRIADPQEDWRLRALLIPQIPMFGGVAAAASAKRILTRETDPELRIRLNEVLWDYY